VSEPETQPTARAAWSILALAAWCLGVLACASVVVALGRWQPSGATDTWRSEADRLPRDLSWIELRIAEGEPADEQRLADAAEQIGEILGPRRVALAPPLHAMASWLDARGWWLVDPEAHAELAARFETEAVDMAVSDLRAELSSPFALLDVDERRRDPLAIRAAWLPGGGRIGDDVPSPGVRASDRGDWLAADGRGVLIAIRSRDPATAWLPPVEKEATRLGLVVTRTDVGARERAAASALGATLARFLLVVLTALTLTFAVGLRNAALTGLTLVAIGAGLLVVLALGGSWSPDATPITVALLAALTSLAAGIDATAEEQRWAVLGMSIAWLAALVAPWPALNQAALPCLVATLFVNFPIRWACTREATAVSPVRARAWGGTRRLAVGIALLLPGWVALTHTALRAPRELHGPVRSPADPFATLAERYIDPDARAWIEDRGPDEATALAAASATASTLIDTRAPTSLDAVGIVVLPDEILPQRRAALGALNLRTRVERVAAALEGQGLRAEAFGEFVDNLDQLTRPPSAKEALASPLAPWLRHALHESDGEVIAHTSVNVPRGATLPEITRPDGSVSAWRGPAAAARRDAERLLEHVAVILAGVAWAVAFSVWMVTRRFDVAILATLIGASALGIGAAWVVWRGAALSPSLTPAAIVVLATMITSAARVSLVLIEGQPRAASTLLLGALAPAVVGAAALFGLPLADDVGMLLLAGCGGGVLLLLLVPPVMLAPAGAAQPPAGAAQPPAGAAPAGPTPGSEPEATAIPAEERTP
jgi:hypothetical protein